MSIICHLLLIVQHMSAPPLPKKLGIKSEVALLDIDNQLTLGSPTDDEYRQSLTTIKSRLQIYAIIFVFMLYKLT